MHLTSAPLRAASPETSLTGNERLPRCLCKETTWTDSRLCTSVMQGQEHSFIQAGSVQIPRNWFSCPTVQLQLFWVGCVGVRLGQDVAIPVLVEGVLQRVSMRGQALSRKQRVTETQKLHAGISQVLSQVTPGHPLQSCPCAQGLHTRACVKRAHTHPLQTIYSLWLISDITGLGSDPRHLPGAEAAERQLKVSQVPLSLTAGHPCAHPCTLMAPPLSPPGFLGRSRGPSVLLLALGSSALPAAAGSHSPWTHKPGMVRSCSGAPARTESPGREGQSSQTKISSWAQVPLPTVNVNQASLPTSTAKSTTFICQLDSGQLFRCLNLEQKLKEIEQQNKLNLSFSGEN